MHKTHNQTAVKTASFFDENSITKATNCEKFPNKNIFFVFDSECKQQWLIQNALNGH
jgi:hypothetical protein